LYTLTSLPLPLHSFLDIPLVPSDSSVPVVSSPHRTLGAYHPIQEELDDATSVDSYTMALEGEGR